MPFRQIRREATESCPATAPRCVEENSRGSEDQRVWDSHGETDWNKKALSEGNGQSRNYRARMNSWSFGLLQRQIEYKARWAGVRVIYVPTRNTSKRCSICGYKTLENTQRRLWCPHCGTILDRDENAARNLAAGGLRFSPNGPPDEAVKGNPTTTVILGVDGGKLSQQATTTIHPTKT